MKKSLLIIFLLLIVTPVSVITWMGFTGYQRERASFAERYRMLARNQLAEIDRLINAEVESVVTELRELRLAHTYGADELRRLSRESGIIRQLFILDSDNTFLFPSLSVPVSSSEAAFLQEAEDLELASALGMRSRDTDRGAESYGWHTWFIGEGIQFAFWQVPESGTRVGIVIERVALISRIVASLPDSDIGTGDSSSRTTLDDAKGDTLYQWGFYTPTVDEEPLAEIALAAPLGAWHLSLYLNPGPDSPSPIIGEYASLLLALVGVLLVIVFLAFYFLRENTRLIRDALQKVSFVNQVSHELRTPLTNIRLYSELLQSNLADEAHRGHLRVIMSEARRLGRMINNVLTFSQAGRGGFEAHPSDAYVDEIVGRVVESFAPALREKNFQVDVRSSAPLAVHTDADFLEQIVANLVGNSEKYAASGRYLQIVTSQTGERTSIVVKDRGPGIPHKERRKIFRPFYRISDRLSEGVTGAGIGLAISRRLTEALHGQLLIESDGSGAAFRLEFGSMTEKENA